MVMRSTVLDRTTSSGQGGRLRGGTRGTSQPVSPWHGASWSDTSPRTSCRTWSTM